MQSRVALAHEPADPARGDNTKHPCLGCAPNVLTYTGKELYSIALFIYFLLF